MSSTSKTGIGIPSNMTSSPTADPPSSGSSSDRSPRVLTDVVIGVSSLLAVVCLVLGLIVMFYRRRIKGATAPVTPQDCMEPFIAKTMRDPHLDTLQHESGFIRDRATTVSTSCSNITMQRSLMTVPFRLLRDTGLRNTEPVPGCDGVFRVTVDSGAATIYAKALKEHQPPPLPGYTEFWARLWKETPDDNCTWRPGLCMWIGTPMAATYRSSVLQPLREPNRGYAGAVCSYTCAIPMTSVHARAAVFSESTIKAMFTELAWNLSVLRTHGMRYLGLEDRALDTLGVYYTADGHPHLQLMVTGLLDVAGERNLVVQEHLSLACMLFTWLTIDDTETQPASVFGQTKDSVHEMAKSEYLLPERHLSLLQSAHALRTEGWAAQQDPKKRLFAKWPSDHSDTEAFFRLLKVLRQIEAMAVHEDLLTLFLFARAYSSILRSFNMWTAGREPGQMESRTSFFDDCTSSDNLGCTGALATHVLETGFCWLYASAISVAALRHLCTGSAIFHVQRRVLNALKMLADRHKNAAFMRDRRCCIELLLLPAHREAYCEFLAALNAGAAPAACIDIHAFTFPLCELHSELRRGDLIVVTDAKSEATKNAHVLAVLDIVPDGQSFYVFDSNGCDAALRKTLWDDFPNLRHLEAALLEAFDTIQKEYNIIAAYVDTQSDQTRLARRTVESLVPPGHESNGSFAARITVFRFVVKITA